MRSPIPALPPEAWNEQILFLLYQKLFEQMAKDFVLKGDCTIMRTALQATAMGSPVTFVHPPQSSAVESAMIASLKSIGEAGELALTAMRKAAEIATSGKI